MTAFTETKSARVARLQIAGNAPDWASQARALVAPEALDGAARVLVISIPPDLAEDAEGARRLNSLARASARVVIVVLDGRYGASALTVAAGADMVIASDETKFVIDPDGGVGFDETWLQDLSIRNAKWLLYAAGPLGAAALEEDGFFNFVCGRDELAARVDSVSAHVARIAGDVLAIKKRAHDGRMRFVNSPL